MTEVQVVGIGAWSPKFGSWDDLQTGLRGGEWSETGPLKPELIPPRERRRSPQMVKMAVEVMDQACRMAGIKHDEPAVVFSSSMGDMQITDYMCGALAQTPKLVSPTRFHNSVHNASPGYWSIATSSFRPASAVSAFEHTPSMALLEALIQVAEENIPVLVVTMELAAPLALQDACPTDEAFACALLLAPGGYSADPVSTLTFKAAHTDSVWPSAAVEGLGEIAENRCARWLPILESIANERDVAQMQLPVSSSMSLELSIDNAEGQ